LIRPTAAAVLRHLFISHRQGIDGVMTAERRIQGGKADLFQFVIRALCDDVPNLKERLVCLDR